VLFKNIPLCLFSFSSEWASEGLGSTNLQFTKQDSEEMMKNLKK